MVVISVEEEGFNGRWVIVWVTGWTYGGVISFMLQFLLDFLFEDVQHGLDDSRSVQYNLLHCLFRHMKAQLGKYLSVHMQKQSSQRNKHVFLV